MEKLGWSGVEKSGIGKLEDKKREKKSKKKKEA